jgi:hypothetical protein
MARTTPRPVCELFFKKKFKFHKFVTRVIKMINFNYYKHRYTNMATSNKYKCTQTHSKFIWYPRVSTFREPKHYRGNNNKINK